MSIRYFVKRIAQKLDIIFSDLKKKSTDQKATPQTLSKFKSKLLGRSIIRQNNAKSSKFKLDKAKQSEKEPLSSHQDEIDLLASSIEQYEELITKDFIIPMEEINFELNKFKTELIQSLAHNASTTDKNGVDLQEFQALYSQACLMVEELLHRCNNYTKTVKNIKQSSPANQKIQLVEEHISKVMQQLQKGQELVDTKHNKHYNNMQYHLNKNTDKLVLSRVF